MISFDNKRISLDDKILNYRVEGFGKKRYYFFMVYMVIQELGVITFLISQKNVKL